MGTVHAQTEIAATPAEVWAVLSDLSDWHTWNEVMVDGRCDGGPGSRLSVKVRVGPIWYPVRSRAHTWTEGSELIWGENLGFFLRINHGFRLHQAGGGTRVEHFEHFEGLVGRVIYPFIARTLHRNYGEFLDALKARVEASNSSSTPAMKE